MSNYKENFDIPYIIEDEIATLKKTATEYKKSDIKKSIELLFKAANLNDKYYVDLTLYVRIAKYLVIDKQYDRAFRLMQATIDKLANYNYINIFKFKHYGDMNTIVETISFICYNEDKIKTALFYKLQSMSYNLILQSLGSAQNIFSFDEWLSLNTNRLYNNILKNLNESIEVRIKQILEEVYEMFEERIFASRDYYSDNSDMFNPFDPDPDEFNELISEIVKIPNIISDKFNMLEIKGKK